MTKKFDKLICIENIYYLAKLKGIRIGELEKKAGVSAGYLSRINRDDNTASPSIECLTAIASELDVTLDFLLGVVLGQLTPTDRYVLKFINKLTERTVNGDIDWEHYSPTQLYSKIVVEDKSYTIKVPLLSVEYSEFINGPELRYIPYSGNPLPIENVEYFCRSAINYSSYIYLVALNGDNKELYYDLQFVGNGEAEPLCSSLTTQPIISQEITNLYKTIISASNRLHIKPSVQRILDNFMNEKH